METLQKIQAGLLKLLSATTSVIDMVSSAIDVEELSKSADHIKVDRIKGDNADLLSAYTKVFSSITKTRELIHQLGKIVLDPSEHSSTFRAELSTILTKLNAKLIAFDKEIKILNDELVLTISENQMNIIRSAENPIALIDELRSMYYKSPGLIRIYTTVVTRCMDTLDRKYSYQLLEYIEQDKARALANYIPKSKLKRKPINNPPMDRFGLLPMTKCMPLKQLIPLVFNEEKIPVSDNTFAKIAKHIGDKGLIVMNSVTYTPVEYNIRPLIVPEEAASYLQPNEYGINTKTIDRFKTIDTPAPTNKWKFSIEVFNQDAQKFYVLETLDGVTYRAMAPWLSSNTFSVARFRLLSLLNNAKNPAGITMATEYHARVSECATKNMFLSKALNLEDFEPKLTDVESGKIQNNIIDALHDTVDKIIKKEYKNKIKNVSQISDILHHEQIVKTFTIEAMRQLSDNEENLNGGKFPSSEIMCSFIVSLQTTARRFAREIHNGYTRNPITPKDFTDDSKRNFELSVEKIKSVIVDAVGLVVKLENNIFTANYYKYLILNYAV